MTQGIIIFGAHREGSYLRRIRHLSLLTNQHLRTNVLPPLETSKTKSEPKSTRYILILPKKTFSLKFPHISHVTIAFFVSTHSPRLQVLYRPIIARLHRYQPLYRAFRQSLRVQSWPTLPLCPPAVTHPLRISLQTNPESSSAIFKNSNISLATRK